MTRPNDADQNLPAPGGYPAAPQSAQGGYLTTPMQGGYPSAPSPGYSVAPQYVSDKTGQNVQMIIAWILTVLTFAYFLPWAIAATRGKSNAGAIGLLNLFLGWTIIGWIAALVMACGTHQIGSGGTHITMVQAVGSHYPPYYLPPQQMAPPAAMPQSGYYQPAVTPPARAEPASQLPGDANPPSGDTTA